MAFARTFTERITTALLSFVATGMAIGGMGLAGLGLTLRQTGIEMAGMPVIVGGLIGVGAVLAISGGVSLIWARRSAHFGEYLEVPPGGRVIALAVFAAALPLVLATQLGGLAAYWRDIARLAVEYEVWTSANGPSALVFVPAMGVLLVPAVQAIAAGVVTLSCILLLALVTTRVGAGPKLVAIGALLAAGLTIASWLGTAVTERIVPSAEAVIRSTAVPRDQEQDRALALLQRHRLVVATSAWTLSWAWVALALLAAGTRAFLPVTAGEPELIGDPAALRSPDETTRAEALLEAAERLHQRTPPRRF
jgi:hypothetical protein